LELLEDTKNGIEDLNLNQNKNNNEDRYINFNTLPNIKNLKKLNLSNNSLNLLNILGLSNNLKSNTSIQHLNLSSNHIDNKGLKYLFGGLKNNFTLKILLLSDNIINEEEDVFEMEEYFKTGSLVELGLSSNKINKKILTNITNGLKRSKSPKLKVLDLQNNKFSSVKGLKGFVKNNNSINELDLSWNKLDAKNMNEIVHSIVNGDQRIERLRMKEVIIENQDDEMIYVNSINDLIKSKMKKLEIGKNKSGMNIYSGVYHLNYLFTLYENYHLEELNILDLFDNEGLKDFFKNSIFQFKELKIIKIEIVHNYDEIYNLIYNYFENSNTINHFELLYYKNNSKQFDLIKLLCFFEKKDNLKSFKFNNEGNMKSFQILNKIKLLSLNYNINKFGIFKNNFVIDDFIHFCVDEYFNLKFIYNNKNIFF
jgi:DNA-binding protein YbaB